MGRPEPCVLFAQTFVHPYLDEYVDEVLFAEPIVVTGCEFLEQNASSASQALTLVGATSPPSFALEVFVQCEGETRFRRLCQPFLYSHYSSNVLDVEAVVTSHLVVRGSYRSLSLVIYGNTAEDLGQFNIECDDSSITNLVTSAEGKIEDLPLALRSSNRTIEESLSSLKVLSLPSVVSDITVDVKKFLQLTSKVLELSIIGHTINKVVSTVVSAASSFVSNDFCCEAIKQKHCALGGSKNSAEINHIMNEARKELLEFVGGHSSSELLAECNFLETEADLATSKQLVDMLSQYFDFQRSWRNAENDELPQNKNVLLGLGMALLLCSGRESCFHFVNSGGMEQIAHVFSCSMQNSSPIALLLLGVIEQATRYSVGCEGFLGWWPREDENIPSGISKGYSQLLKLFLQKPRHDVASLATYILHRLRFYEVVSRYENAVLSVLEGQSARGRVTSVTLDMLISAKLQLENILKLINSRGPIEDPSPAACTNRSLCIGQTEGLLSYKATSYLIGSSTCCFSNGDMDSHLLTLLKERGFIPLSAALLASPILRSEVGDVMETFVDIASTIGAIVLALLSCRSGLIFLSHQPDLAATLVGVLKGDDDMHVEECVPLRYASVLISKGFVCSPREVGMILEIHLRVVNAVDRLLLLSPDSEEFLWVLWELCGLSRSNCGLQALLILGYFPEALKLLIEALHSVKELGPISKDTGTSPPNIAIFHSAAEIFEIIVTDSTASSLSSWIEYAIELQKALRSSSPGSNRKDAPARLLEWIDAGVVYHKNGVIGVLRYAAVLASGGDAHLSSSSILVSDLTDMDNVDGDSSASPDLNVVDNLWKVISEKTFDGVTLLDSSVAQLTTAMRILAFISENSTVAAALYDEGAITIIYAVLVNCSFMLERFSNSYDYLVDESTEGNSTSDLLVERYREQSLVDLLVPSLVLLSNLLHKLQEANEQHRNTRLMNALLRLHREVSTKLVACAADLPSAYPDSALGFGAVCHLIVAAVACWPVYGWTPGLFHSLITSVQATSLQALGPKEACSFLCILNDLFPEEGIWLWRNGMPLLCGLRRVAVGTLLGPLKGRQVDWYLEAGHLEKLLCQLNPQLDKIAQIVKHYAISALAVIQDMLRVLIIRIACQKGKNASVLLRPILSWIQDHVSDLSPPSDVDAYKVCRFLDFIASLLEHPRAKALVLEEEGMQLLLKVLEKCFHAIDSDGKQSLDSEKARFTMISWCLPVFKSFALLCNPQTSPLYPGRDDTYNNSGEIGGRDCLLLLSHILKFCQVLPVGKQLLSCLTAFKELGSCYEGRQALLTTVLRDNSGIVDFESERQPERDEKYILNDLEWSEFPLLCCWKKLLKSVDTEDALPAHTIEAVNALCLGSLCFCIDGKSLDLNAVAAIRCLFGLPDDVCKTDGFPEDKLKLIQEMTTVLSEKMRDGNYVVRSDMWTILYRVSESARLLLAVLENNNGSFKVDDIVSVENVLSCTNEVLVSLDIPQMSDGTAEKAYDSLFLGALGEKFLWECPETLPDRLPLTTISGKRKIPPLDGPGRRIRGDNSVVETTGQNSFLRGSVPPTSSGPTRRDIFRQRKPNTSRPPSMHVDDYVTRERSVDGVSSSSNVIAVQRVGLTGGRPPSIHVDEFMARQRERQNPTVTVVGEGSAQVKNVTPLNDIDMEKADKLKQLKSDLDDDLQGIDIVFDAEENESDDKLPFPQPDDNLQQPAPLTVEQSSSHSIVEETGNDADEGSQFSRLGTPVYADENAQSEFSSRMSVSRPEVPLTREPSVSSDKKFPEQSEDFRNDIHIKTSSGHDSAGPSNSSRFPTVFSNAPSSVQLPADSRIFPQNFYTKNSPQHAGSLPVAAGSRGLYDQKNLLNQPPLPPMPPPQSISHAVSQSSELAQGQSSPFVNSLTDGLPQVLTAFQVQSEYARTTLSSPSRSARHPPLPPTPPPFSSSSYNLPSVKTSGSQYNQITSGTTEFPQTSVSSMIDTRSGNFSLSGQASYPPLPLMPPSVFSRPSSVPMTLYGSAQTQQLGENPANIMQNLSIPLSSIQSVHSLVQLQPLQPPQIIRPLQPPQHFRPPIQVSQQLEQVAPLHNPVQMQMLQQPQVSPNQTYYQSQQPEFSHAQQLQQVEHSQLQVAHQQGNITSQQLQDSGMSLHEYFKSPEAIQSLLSDRDKLCQLLEQHPKLMQMLQEKLGQL